MRFVRRFVSNPDVRAIVTGFCLLSAACGRNHEDDKSIAPPSPTLSAAPVGSDSVSTALASSSVNGASSDAGATSGRGQYPALDCCTSLRHDAGGATPQAQGAFLMAALECDAMLKRGRVDSAKLRTMILGEPLPAACK